MRDVKCMNTFESRNIERKGKSEYKVKELYISVQLFYQHKYKWPDIFVLYIYSLLKFKEFPVIYYFLVGIFKICLIKSDANFGTKMFGHEMTEEYM